MASFNPKSDQITPTPRSLEELRNCRLCYKTPVETGKGDLTTEAGAQYWVEWWTREHGKDGWYAWYEIEPLVGRALMSDDASFIPKSFCVSEAKRREAWTAVKTEKVIEIIATKGLKFGFPIEQAAVVELLVVAINAEIETKTP